MPVIRWPGGCAADSYDWRDGIGPRAKRPRRTNFWEVDPDAAGCTTRAARSSRPMNSAPTSSCSSASSSGAEPYIAANLRSLPPLDFDHWVEYCNSPAGSTTLADDSAAAGSAEPFGVRYWGVGQRKLGLRRQFHAGRICHRVPPIHHVGSALRSGSARSSDRDRMATMLTGRNGSSNRFRWPTRVFEPDFTRLVGAPLRLEPEPRQDERLGEGKGDALNFESVDWYELLHEAGGWSSIINDHWAAMGQYDTSAAGEARCRRVWALVPGRHRGGYHATSSDSRSRCAMRSPLL